MEIRHLKYFNAVAKELSFVKASERLHVTQPALSRQIKDLEEELGTQLFYRLAQGIELTQAGEYFLSSTEEILNRLKIAVEETSSLTLGQRGRISLGIYCPPVYSVFFDRIALYEQKFPEINLNILTMNDSDQIMALRQGIIDMAIFDSSSYSNSDDHMISQPCLSEGLCAIVPYGHRFEKHESIRLSELKNENVIIDSKSIKPLMQSLSDEYQKETGLPLSVVKEVSEHSFAVCAVRSGLGVALSPMSMSRIHVDGVTYIPIQPSTVQIKYVAVYRPERLNPILKNFLNFLSNSSIFG